VRLCHPPEHFFPRSAAQPNAGLVISHPDDFGIVSTSVQAGVRVPCRCGQFVLVNVSELFPPSTTTSTVTHAGSATIEVNKLPHVFEPPRDNQYYERDGQWCQACGCARVDTVHISDRHFFDPFDRDPTLCRVCLRPREEQDSLAFNQHIGTAAPPQTGRKIAL